MSVMVNGSVRVSCVDAWTSWVPWQVARGRGHSCVLKEPLALGGAGDRWTLVLAAELVLPRAFACRSPASSIPATRRGLLPWMVLAYVRGWVGLLCGPMFLALTGTGLGASLGDLQGWG